jgi:hypothetical protein
MATYKVALTDEQLAGLQKCAAVRGLPVERMLEIEIGEALDAAAKRFSDDLVRDLIEGSASSFGEPTGITGDLFTLTGRWSRTDEPT